MKPVVVMLALGGLGIAGFAYAKSAEKKKKVSAALDLGLGEVSGCEYTENQLKSFAQISNFTIYWFNKADADKRAAELGVDSWVKVPPKPEIASNPMARVFNDDACHFIMWNGSRWVPDNVTQAAFVLWTKGPQQVPPGTLPIPPGSGLPDTPPFPGGNATNIPKPADWPSDWPWPPPTPLWWPGEPSAGLKYPFPVTSKPDWWPNYYSWPPSPDGLWWPISVPFPPPG